MLIGNVKGPRLKTALERRQHGFRKQRYTVLLDVLLVFVRDLVAPRKFPLGCL